jgi:hypothetical protein
MMRVGAREQIYAKNGNNFLQTNGNGAIRCLRLTPESPPSGGLPETVTEIPPLQNLRNLLPEIANHAERRFERSVW